MGRYSRRGLTAAVVVGLGVIGAQPAQAQDWWDVKVCSPGAPGPVILRTPNAGDIHGEWADGFLGDSWNLIRVEDHAGGYMSGCLLSPRASVDVDGDYDCAATERVYVIAREWSCR